MNYTGILGLLLTIQLVYSSSNLILAQHTCLFDSAHAQLILKNPAYRNQVEQLNQQIYLRTKEGINARSSGQVMYVLPVVIHLVIPPGTSIGTGNNLTDQQVEQGMQFLNQAFSNSGPFAAAKGVDVGIQFCLAKRDPLGRPTSGITRTESMLTNDPMCSPGTNSSSDNLIKQLVSWDCRKYINIWLVTDLFNGTFGCGLAGYAYFPGAPCSVDGIVQEARYWNTVGGTVVTAHEMGHYLGLHHTFNGGCNNQDCLLDGDRVCDTPPDNSASFAACNTNSCNTDNPDLQDDNDNFMDYSNCRPAHFTSGQASRMISALEISRNGLIGSDGCLLVGEYDAVIHEFNISGDYCLDTVCPSLIFGNAGLRNISSLRIYYSVNGSPELNLSWNGLVAPGQKDSISLQCFYLPYGTHSIKIRIELPNPSDDLYSDNNEKVLSFSNFPKPEISLLATTPTNCRSDGTITVETRNGSSPYSYRISNRIFAQNDPYFQLLTAGGYTITVTDLNGCTDTISVFVPDSCKSTTNKNFILNNDAVSTGGDCYRLTQALNNQAGSMWYEDKVDFTNSFDVFFDFNLGCIDRNGADGMAFVLQPISTSIGIFGGGIGYQGIVPSLAVEFDTWDNNEFNDPFYDHLAIMRNGTVGHNTPDNLAGPVGIFPTLANAEDCMWHKGLIRWNAISKTLEVYVDCNRRLSLRIDLVQDIFRNDPNVFFGFTSATGGAVNVHQVCLNYITGINNIADQVICAGESIQLSAPSVFNTYLWSPTNGVSDPSSRNPIFTPDSTTTYFLRMNDQCGLIYLDTVTIEVKQADLKVKASLQDSCSSLDEIILEVLNPEDFPGAEYSLNGQEFGPEYQFRVRSLSSVTVYAKIGNCIIPRILDLRDQRIPLRDSIIFTQSLTCKDSGIIVIQGIGGLPPYEFSLDRTNWNTDGHFEKLSPGLVRVYTRDALGCEVFRDVEIVNFGRKINLKVDSSKLSVNCCDRTNYISVSASGTFPFYYYSLNGQRWVHEPLFSNLEPGTHFIVVRDEFGCTSDSLHFIVEDFQQKDSTAQFVEICARDSFPFNANVYFESGVYKDVFQNIHCCDSVVHTFLNVLPEIVVPNPVSLCSGASYQIHGKEYSVEGYYWDTLKSSLACDSIVVTHLQLLAADSILQNIALCEGEYFEVGTNRYEQLGVYRDTLQTIMGCDSVLITEIEINPVDRMNQNYLICEDDVIQIGNKVYHLPGTYIDTISNRFGCDSIIQTHLKKDSIHFNPLLFPPKCYGINDGVIVIQVLNGLEPFEYSIDPNQNWVNNVRFDQLSPGSYRIQVRDSLGCIKSLSAILPEPFIPLVSIAPEIQISLGDMVKLEPTVNFVPSLIEWSPAEGLSCTDCLEPYASPLRDMLYKLKLLDENGCEIFLEIALKLDLDGQIYVPNVFSPNGDLVNDRITVFGTEAFKEIENFRIYSRWGELMFENSFFPPNDLNSGWDGQMNGKPVNPGVFIYFVKAKRLDGTIIELKGDLSLIR
ncbi:MAG: gliding motility-associated C-terminal domain-containing protein [Saprospiraceae bacterium]|nr:gliding motility-associated C-terminal domain-containing protein [Saprospiraceae bacterium]